MNKYNTNEKTFNNEYIDTTANNETVQSLNENNTENSQITENNTKNTPKRNRIFTKSFVIYLLILLAVLGLSRCFSPVKVVGESMENTLHNKDIVIRNTYLYKFAKPERGDMVIIHTDYAPDGYIVKRVIGLPGETIKVTSDGNVYINGKKSKQNFTKEGVTEFYGENQFDKNIKSEVYKVPKNRYFVMGDNRQNSADSRDSDIGYIKRSQMKGKVVFRLFPLNGTHIMDDADVL